MLSVNQLAMHVRLVLTLDTGVKGGQLLLLTVR